MKSRCGEFDNLGAFRADKKLMLGDLTTYNFLSDPKRMAFVLCRYKFCSKILRHKRVVLEIGCGDAFGSPIVAKAVGKLYAIDREERLINDNIERLSIFKNIHFEHIDFPDMKCFFSDQKFDGIYLLDVIEHIDEQNENAFMSCIVNYLKDDGICIIGTPNIVQSKYSSFYSKKFHVNEKSYESLYGMMLNYFKNVIIFGMNDEIVHTGFNDLCHYFIGVGMGVKNG